MLEMKELDKSSFKTANDSKVAELAKLCIEIIKANPGVLRDQIIEKIDR